MITKEQLEELIEQGATIYGIDDRWDIVEVRELDAKQIYCSSSNDNYQYVFDDCGVVEFFEDDLFETKEEAEWYVKYGEVTKSETISFPTYEKMMQDLEGKTGIYTIIDASNVLLEVNLGKHYVDQIYLYTKEDKFNWNLSKEGYEQACEMCVCEFKK